MFQTAVALSLKSEERLECGCKVQTFRNGRRYQSGCALHRQAYSYICEKCKQLVKSLEMFQRHRYTHAY